MATDRLAALHRLLEAEPDDAFCLYGIAQEHVRRGDRAAAIAWFDRTIAAHPDHAYAWFHRAKVQADAGQRGAAVDSLRSGLAAARRSGDQKAASEIQGWLDELDGGP